MGGLETTSNDLDPDFSRSSLRLSRFFCPNLGDLPPPQKGLQRDRNPVSLVEYSSGP